tara:strand:- start:1650 stop:2432 length:783 start_codon:yes stop_codon:yes gene_type:complete
MEQNISFTFNRDYIKNNSATSSITYNEYLLLCLLLDNQHKKYTPRRDIEEYIWSGNFVESNNLNTLIYKLRMKFIAIGIKKSIINIPRKGYRFDEDLYISLTSSQQTESAIVLDENPPIDPTNTLKLRVEKPNKEGITRKNLTLLLTLLIILLFPLFSYIKSIFIYDYSNKAHEPIVLEGTLVAFDYIKENKRKLILDAISEAKINADVAFIHINKMGTITVSCNIKGSNVYNLISQFEDIKKLPNELTTLVKKCSDLNE